MLLGRSRATRRHGRSVELLQLQERARGQRGHLGSAGSNGSHVREDPATRSVPGRVSHTRTLRHLKPQFPKLYNFFEGAWSPARSPRDPATPNGLIGLTVTLFRSAARGVVGEYSGKAGALAVRRPCGAGARGHHATRHHRAQAGARAGVHATRHHRHSHSADQLSNPSQCSHTLISSHTLTSRLYSWSELARV